MLTVAVLGPVEVRLDGERLALPSGKTTEVLVRLALEAGRLVRAERMIEDLWGDAATGLGRNTLQSKVSQLRRALSDPARVATGNGGYSLSIDGSCVDALRVVGLAASAAASRRSGDASAALEAATRGLGLFRGEVLVDAGDGEWLQAHRARLEEVRLGLLEDRLCARLELGAGGEVVAELEGLVNEHPLREGLWCCLITALYRTGRQADALAAYTRVRAALIDELGIEPGPGLRDLECQILQQSPALVATVEERPAVPAPPVGNLPALTAPLVGRAHDIAALDDLIRERRLVTIVGPAGVGKTRLAIELGHRSAAPGGVWLVRLDAADATTSISQAVAETLQLAGGAPMLVERFSGAETVLVLDNCEHLVEAVAELAGHLLDATTRLRVLVTSQSPLGLDGEAAYVLEPLPVAESMALFADRATQIRRGFVLDGDTAAAVEELCLSLDGLPLAIELAAARVRSLSVPEIVRRLDDRFALLQDPTSRRPERRRALAAAIAWSYGLLFPDDQRGLWALSCFSGGAPLAAAEHVLGALGVPGASATDVVGRLVDRSLVSVEIADESAVRYRLLDSIRVFAFARLRESGLVDDACSTHARWFADVADRCATTVRGAAQADCLAVVRAERANIDAALAWSAEHDPRLGVRIANGFGWTWVVLGDGVAGATRVRAALAAAEPLTTPQEKVTGLLLAGWLEASAGNVERAQTDLDEALGLAEQLDDEHLRADVHRHLAFLRIQQGRPLAVLDLATASLTVYRPLGLHWETAASLLLAAFAAIMLGDTARATRAAQEAVQLLAPIGDSWGGVHAEAMIGAIAQAERRFTDAAQALSRAAATSQELGFLGQAALHLTTLGRVEQRAGNTEAAIDTLNRAIQAADTNGDLRIAATARVHLARILRASGEDADALSLLEQTDRWFRASGGGDGALLTRCLLASTSSRADGLGAVETLQAVLDDARRAQDREVQVLALDGLARVAAEAGDLVAAQQLLDSADELIPGIRHAVDELDRLDAQRAQAVIARGVDAGPVAPTPGDSSG
ncbi:MAG: BTAD domain-containing putative transcriptional regulator [Kineosporiaceae bacterium]